MTHAPLDLRDRDALFQALEERTYDLAIVGGGITGAGIARDAALRGLSVALVEAGDFASGTSSRSSKMIHGGLRYLAQGDLALVREAASERKAVQAIAPHLARETPFVIPARGAGAIARLRAALWTFEKLGGVPRSRAHEVWSAAELKAREPVLAAEDLAGAVVYPEYLTNDARLTLANIRSAADAGARVVNYARATGFCFEGERVSGVEVADQTPGGGERRVRLAARVMVNAAGPWVDAVRALEAPEAAPRLALSRGIHLVVAHERVPVVRTLIIPAGGRRSIFVVPHGSVTYIGTTDTFHHPAETWPPITGEDAAYLFAAASAALEVDPLTAADVTAAWSGLRPLVGEAGKSASEVSRRDEVWTGPGGVIAIAGGKLTAYRRMAERVVDQVEKALGRARGPCRTAALPLVGGDAAPEAVRAALIAAGSSAADADRRVGLWGGEAPAVGAGAAAEAAFAVLSEGALTLEDYWVRRGGRAWFDPDGGLSALAPAAAAMAPLLGWSGERVAEEIAACRRRREADMAMIADDRIGL
ncbi:MAG TPA: glycerol-3-phosphate dehydrogenase/oxidase [Caulobacteraceae bacterium]|nr:glycerol-3-phosphate dehydrogenase/oxidase [Caulobacteraceae bacterium]